jgi:hypothetical protein
MRCPSRPRSANVLSTRIRRRWIFYLQALKHPTGRRHYPDTNLWLTFPQLMSLIVTNDLAFDKTHLLNSGVYGQDVSRASPRKLAAPTATPCEYGQGHLMRVQAGYPG